MIRCPMSVIISIYNPQFARLAESPAYQKSADLLEAKFIADTDWEVTHYSAVIDGWSTHKHPLASTVPIKRGDCLVLELLDSGFTTPASR